MVQGHKFPIGHRLRRLLVADAVNARQQIGLHKDVVFRGAVLSELAQNGTHILSFTGDGHKGPAVGDLIGLTGNAAHQALAHQAAFGPAVPDLRLRQAYNAADPLGILGIHIAVALTGDDGTQGALAGNAAGHLLLGLDGAVIHALVHQAPGLYREVQGLIANGGQIVLRVQVVFPGQGTYDAAGVDIRVYVTVVHAVPDLTGGILFHILAGYILRQILIVLPAAEDVHHPADLAAQVLDIIQDRISLAGGRIRQGAHGFDGIRQALTDQSGGGPHFVKAFYMDTRHFDIRVAHVRVDLRIRVRLHHRDIHPLGDDLQQIVDGPHKGIRVVLHLAQAALKGAVRAGGIVGGPAQDIGQGLGLLLQLLQRILAVYQNVVGLHLAQNAAALLPGLDKAEILALRHKAAAGARHTAYIIAGVLVANVALVFAAPDDAAAGAHHAADIGAGDLGVLGGELGKGDVLQVDAVVRDLGVDTGLVDAACNHPLIFADNTAYHLCGPDVALGGAGDDTAGNRVVAHQAPHLIGGLQGAGEGDILDGAVADSHHAADPGGAAGGQDLAHHLQIHDLAVLLKVAEQALGRALCVDLYIGNFVVPAVEDAAEGGDLQVGMVRQGNIVRQSHLQVPAGAVQTAPLGKAHQVLCRGDLHLFIVGGLGFLRGFRGLLRILLGLCGLALHRQAQGQGGCQHQAGKPSYILFHFWLPSSMAGCSSMVSRLSVEMAALIWPVSTPLISASTIPLM